MTQMEVYSLQELTQPVHMPLRSSGMHSECSSRAFVLPVYYQLHFGQDQDLKRYFINGDTQSSAREPTPGCSALTLLMGRAGVFNCMFCGMGGDRSTRR